MENQIREAQQEWLQHQEERFTLDLLRNQDELSASRSQTAPSLASLPETSAFSNLVLEQLNEIEKLIRR